MKTYEKYKDSGVEWIGEIPEHWEVKRLKWIVDERLKYGANESAELDDKELPRYIRITDFGEDGKLKEETFKSLPMDVACDYLLENGDVLFARSGATVGKTFQFKGYKGQACFAGYLIKAKPNKNIVDSDFLYFFTKSAGYESWRNYIFNQATIQNIGADKYSLLEIPIPRIFEQTTIATFLDRKTAEIDRIIANKQKLIALYEEEKQAIINQAITASIQENVTYKKTSTDWLDEIPDSWQFLAMKRLVSTKITDGPHETPEFIPNGVPFLSAESVKNGKIDFDFRRGNISKELDELYSKKYKPKRDDIFIVKSGSTTGKIAIVDFDDDFNIWSPLALVRVNEKVKPYFLYYALQSFYFQKQIQLSWSFGTQPNIGMNVIENLKIAVPISLEEQELIIYHIESELKRLNEIIEKFNKQIELLQEYRTTLISDVVTGKVKVMD